MKKAVEILIGLGTAVVCWLALSYLFFPIKLSATTDVYFIKTITHMVPLKSVITIIFVLLVLFLYEQKVNKEKKK